MSQHSTWASQIVRIRPSTKVGRDAVAKWGNQFWRRPSSGPTTHLIPIKDGIPHVADFIHVPNSDIIQPEAEIGYGSSDTTINEKE